MVKPKKIRILVVAEKYDDFYEWLSKLLEKEFIVKKLYVHSGDEKPPFFLLRWLLVIKRWRSISKSFKPEKILVYGKSLMSIWIVIFLIRLLGLNTEIIIFRYDFEYFWMCFKEIKKTIGDRMTLILEKFCLINSDKIVHKGIENELEFLPYYDKLKNKPHYLFREFINPKKIQIYNPNFKLSKKDGEIHLVYIGGFTSVNLPVAESIWNFYPKITSQRLHLHLYSWFDRKAEEKLKEIENRNPYLHLEGIKDHSSLLKEICKYDYGISLHTRNVSKSKNNYYVAVHFAKKFFDYLSAKLPLVVLKESKAAAEFVDKYKIGVCIDYKDIKSLQKILTKKKKDYEKIIKNIDNAISDSMECKKFLDFVRTQK